MVSGDVQRLREVDLFADLTPDQLNTVANALRIKRYPAGKSLFDVNQPGELTYVVLEGSVKIYDEDRDGRLVVYAILGRGEVVGEMSSIDGGGRSASAVTQEPSLVGWVDVGTFNEWRKRWPALASALTELLARRVRVANAQIRALSTLDVRGRVARILLLFANEYGDVASDGVVTIRIKLTQSDLAGLTGATRVRVNQAISAWKRSGYISISKDQTLEIRRLDALSQQCDSGPS